MKQVTGNNPPQPIDKVSIQLALDGHSFSVPALSGPFPGEGEVGIELLTPRTLLVPVPLFEDGHSAELLAAAGLTPIEGEAVVYSESRNDLIAVMAIPGEVLQAIADALGTRARYTTPLLDVPPRTDAVVWLCHTGGLLYIKVYDGSLQFAEVIPVPGDADIRYFIERLGREFPLAKFEAILAAAAPKQLRKLIGNTFRKVTIENR